MFYDLNFEQFERSFVSFFGSGSYQQGQKIIL